MNGGARCLFVALKVPQEAPPVGGRVHEFPCDFIPDKDSGDRGIGQVLLAREHSTQSYRPWEASG